MIVMIMMRCVSRRSIIHKMTHMLVKMMNSIRGIINSAIDT